MNFERVADGIYKLNGHFYCRPKKPDGKWTWRSLRAPTLKAAKAEYARRSGRALDIKFTCGDALRHYIAAGCPNKHRQARDGVQGDQELSRAGSLLTYWSEFPCVQLSNAALDDFADWRIRHCRKGFHGGRAADLEIVTLKNAVRWVVRRGLLAQDPFALLKISAYRKPIIRHCRESAPRSGDELHDIAAHLFEEPRGQVIAWLALITAMVGGRVSEMISLRTDAGPQEPGNITDGVLWLRRAKKGSNNFFRIHPDLQVALEEFWRWRKWKLGKRKSDWWFIGKDVSTPIGEQSLTHALRRAGELVCGTVRTAHGLRSFYVTVRRSQGASDPQIALEIGQTSGGREIVRTYGEATPIKVSWMPEKGKPAWEELYKFYQSSLPCKQVSKKGKIIRFPGKNAGRRSLPASSGSGLS